MQSSSGLITRLLVLFLEALLVILPTRSEPVRVSASIEPGQPEKGLIRLMVLAFVRTLLQVALARLNSDPEAGTLVDVEENETTIARFPGRTLTIGVVAARKPPV